MNTNKIRGKDYIEEGKRKIQLYPHYGLSMSEIENIFERLKDEDPLSVVVDVFYLGVEAGARLTQRH